MPQCFQSAVVRQVVSFFFPEGMDCEDLTRSNRRGVCEAMALAKRPHVVVATPGRLVDHLENTKATAKHRPTRGHRKVHMRFALTSNHHVVTIGRFGWRHVWDRCDMNTNGTGAHAMDHALDQSADSDARFPLVKRLSAQQGSSRYWGLKRFNQLGPSCGRCGPHQTNDLRI